MILLCTENTQLGAKVSTSVKTFNVEKKRVTVIKIRKSIFFQICLTSMSTSVCALAR